MRLLITRPQEDAEALAAELAALGHEALIEPLLSVGPLAAAEVDVAGVQALLLTSANGARALQRHDLPRALPVLAVGAATAAAARAAGFADVRAAAGDVEALAALVRRQLRPADGALLHVAGSAVAGDLAGDLSKDGFEIRRAVLYEAKRADRLSEGCAKALSAGQIDGVLLFSPRTAAAFATLLRRQGLADAADELDVYALSQAVATAVEGLPWRRVEVAAQPNKAALLALLQRGNSGMATDKPATEGAKANPAETKPAEMKPGEAVSGGARPAADMKPTNPKPGEAKPGDARPGAATPAAGGAGPWKEGQGTAQAGDDADAAAIVSRLQGSDKDSAPGKAPSKTAATKPSTVPAGSGGRGLLIGLIVGLVIVGGLWAAWPTLLRTASGVLPPELVAMLPKAGSEAGRIDDLAASVATLRDRVDGLEGKAEATSGSLVELKSALAALPAGSSGEEEAVAELRQRMDSVDNALATLSKDSRGFAADLGSLRAEIAALSPTSADDGGAAAAQITAELDKARATAAAAERTAATAQRNAAMAQTENQRLSSEIAALAGRLAALEQSRAKPAIDEERAAVLALGQLSSAVTAGRPYATALITVETILGPDSKGDPDLTALRPHADKGIATLAELKGRFPLMLETALHARSEKGGIWEQTLQRVQSLVTLRRTGDVAGQEPDAVLARAEQMLARNDLAGAVTEVASLQGPAAEASADWLAEARVRVAAEAALQSLGDRVVARMAGG